MRLVVGDRVVYPGHGVGHVTAREKRSVEGAEQDVLVLSLSEGLSVTLPVERAEGLLRPLLSEADLSRVGETLREDHALSADVWVKRMKATQVKLASGDPLELAEIVRDGALRQLDLDRERQRVSSLGERA